MKTFALAFLVAALAASASAQTTSWYCHECTGTIGVDGNNYDCRNKDSDYFGEPVMCQTGRGYEAYACYKSIDKNDVISRGCPPETGDNIAAPWDDNKWDNKNRCKKDGNDKKHCTCNAEKDKDFCNSAFAAQGSSLVIMVAAVLAMAYNRA